MFSKTNYISKTIIKASPIILTGISVAFAFKTGMFNIGAEGQYVAGAIWVVLEGSTLDLAMVALGSIRAVAGFAGMPAERTTVLAMVIAGGISGLAGALMITGIQPHCISTLAGSSRAVSRAWPAPS